MMRYFLLLVFLLGACTPVSNEVTLIPTNSSSARIVPTMPAPEVRQQAQIADDATVDLGEAIYVQNCERCHGSNGVGQFPDNPMQADSNGLIGAAAQNQNGRTWQYDDESLYKIIRDGMAANELYDEMPAFGETLKDNEIAAVIAFIKTLWTEDQRQQQVEHSLRVQEQNQ